MPPFELREGQGTLHRVHEKKTEAAPDYTGEVNIGGTVYRLAGWIKLGKNGKWLSLNCELPRPKAALETPVKPKYQAPLAPGVIDPDADIPF